MNVDQQQRNEGKIGALRRSVSVIYHSVLGNINHDTYYVKLVSVTTSKRINSLLHRKNHLAVRRFPAIETMLLAGYNLQQHCQLDDYDGRDLAGSCRYNNSILRSWPANPRHPSCKLNGCGLDLAVVELIAV